MNNEPQQKKLKKIIYQYHYVFIGIILLIAALYMGYTLVSVINTAPGESEAGGGLSTTFDTETLQRIGELEYSSETSSQEPFDGRNPFE